MRNPYIFFGTMAVLIVAGVLIGNYWDTWFPSKPGEVPHTLPDGTACTTTDGKAGILSGGICVATGGPQPVVSNLTRTPSYIQQPTFMSGDGGRYSFTGTTGQA